MDRKQIMEDYLMKRCLTEEEIEVIKNYNLSPELEQRVRNIWSEGKDLVKSDTDVQKKVGYFIGLGFAFGSPVALLINYLVPGIIQMEGVLNVVRFFFWIILPARAIYNIKEVFKLDENTDEIFKKYALDKWHSKGTILQKLRRVNIICLVIGFILNGYFVSAIMALVCILIISFIEMGISSNIQNAMDDLKHKTALD